MANVLLIFHFLGLMLGVTGSLGGAATLAYSRPAQKQKGGPLRGVGPAFAAMSTFGLIMLWPSGIALLVLSNGAGVASPMFVMKAVFVLLLTFSVLSIQMIYGNARKSAHLPKLLVSLGPLSVISYLLVVIFSVLAFKPSANLAG